MKLELIFWINIRRNLFQFIFPYFQGISLYSFLRLGLKFFTASPIISIFRITALAVLSSS